jgi:hypothetical protein
VLKLGVVGAKTGEFGLKKLGVVGENCIEVALAIEGEFLMALFFKTVDMAI